MGQKTHPHGVRVGIIKDWDSKWYANKKEFGDSLVEDNKIRKYVKKKLYVAGVSKIEIERTAGKVKVKVKFEDVILTLAFESGRHSFFINNPFVVGFNSVCL